MFLSCYNVNHQVLSVKKSLGVLVTGGNSLAASLSHLNLSGCYSLTDQGLLSLLISPLPSLTSVNLSLCKEVSDRSLGRLGSICPALRSLDLGGCTGVTNSGLLLLARTLPNLHTLSLRSCWQLSDAGMAHLARLPIDPDAKEPNLVELDTLNLQDCQKLTDLSLRYIAQGINIKNLNLSFCANISDSGMKSVARMSSLTSLNLRSCDNISDIGVGYLAEGCVSLHTLDVSFCERISDRAMAHIASGLFNLRTLSMAACRVTDEGLTKVAKTLLELQTLNILVSVSKCRMWLCSNWGQACLTSGGSTSTAAQGSPSMAFNASGRESLSTPSCGIEASSKFMSQCNMGGVKLCFGTQIRKDLGFSALERALTGVWGGNSKAVNSSDRSHCWMKNFIGNIF